MNILRSRGRWTFGVIDYKLLNPIITLVTDKKISRMIEHERSRSIEIT
jgi:hypothetical protein